MTGGKEPASPSESAIRALNSAPEGLSATGERDLTGEAKKALELAEAGEAGVMLGGVVGSVCAVAHSSLTEKAALSIALSQRSPLSGLGCQGEVMHKFVTAPGERLLSRSEERSP
jgi:hypothetical protein